MQTSKAYKKWEARINDLTTPWTESDVIYFRKATGHSGLKDRGERVALQALFRDTIGHAGFDGYRITRQHDVKGQAYVISNSQRVDGQLRKGSKFSARELQVFKQLEHHLLVGMWFPQYGNDCWFPIYRAVSPVGYVEYVGVTYEQMTVISSMTDPLPSERRPQLKLLRA
jgi:hypothetical protein